jgi:nucleoside-diphosphate-sugar epimerase
LVLPDFHSALFIEGDRLHHVEGIDMRVLVSGSSGLIGGAVVEHLSAEGDEAVRFDIADGHDVLDSEDYAAAARGCDAIVHAAGGHRPDASDPGERYITHNVTGNWNMLEAARKAGIRRVVTFSSVNAIGVFRGEATPDYLPIDDDHPIRPPTAYGMAKRLVEELCRCCTATRGIATVCFRPPAVCGKVRRAKFAAARAADPAVEWTPYWEYGAWIDVRDVAGAVLVALRCPELRHLTALIIADDVTSPIPPRELAKRLLPDVPWRGPEPVNEWATLVRSDRAREVLGWRPRYRWRADE